MKQPGDVGTITEIQWPPNRGNCPNCKSRLQWHSLTAWCLNCGYGINRTHDPGKLT